jgi:hypothetical protein
LLYPVILPFELFITLSSPSNNWNPKKLPLPYPLKVLFLPNSYLTWLALLLKINLSALEVKLFKLESVKLKSVPPLSPSIIVFLINAPPNWKLSEGDSLNPLLTEYVKEGGIVIVVDTQELVFHLL